MNAVSHKTTTALTSRSKRLRLLAAAAAATGWTSAVHPQPETDAGPADAVDRLVRAAEESTLAGDFAVAASRLEEAISTLVAESGGDHPAVATYQASLGQLRAELGDRDEAATLLRAAVETGRSRLGEDHHLVGAWATRLGDVQVALGKHEAALESYEIARAAKSGGSDFTPRILSGGRLPEFFESDSGAALGDIAAKTGLAFVALERWAEALPQLEEAVRSVEDSYGRGHPRAVSLQRTLEHSRRELGEAVTPKYVGSWGTPKKLTLSGCETYEGEEVKGSLFGNAEILAASHPSEPFERFAELLVAGVRGGLRQSGFLDCEVDLHVRDEHLELEVREGARYRRLPLVVLGSEAIPHEELRYRLSVQAPPANEELARVRRQGVPASLGMIAKIRNGASATGFSPLPSSRALDDLLAAPPAGGNRADGGVDGGEPVSQGAGFPATTGFRPAERGEVQQLLQIARALPVWDEDAPLGFYPDLAELVESQTKAVFSEHGWFFPEVVVDVPVDEEAKTVGLVVRVVESGPKGIVGSVSADGLERDSLEDLLGFLGLAEGMPLHRELLEDVELELWRSGRYMNSSVEWSREGPGSPAVDFHFELLENVHAPALGAEPSRFQRFWLSFANWTTNYRGEGGEFVVRGRTSDHGKLLAELGLPQGPADAGHDATFEFVYAPTQGVAISAFSNAADPGAGAGITLTLEHERMFLGASTGRRRWHIHSPETAQAVAAYIHVVPEGTDGHEIATGFGLGFGESSPSDQSGAPIDLSLFVSPAAAYRMARDYVEWGWEFEESDGELRFRKDASWIAIEPETGRLTSARFQDSADPDRWVTLTLEPDALGEVLKRGRGSVAGVPNGYDARRPLLSWIRAGVQIVADFVAGLPDDRGDGGRGDGPSRHQELLAKLEPAVDAAADIFTAFFQPDPASLAPDTAVGSDSDDRFSLPVRLSAALDGDLLGALGVGGTSQLANPLTTVLAPIVFELAGSVPEGSWPELMAKEVFWATAGHRRFTRDTISELYSDRQEMGPVGFLAATVFLRALKSPDSYRFAEKGLRRLSTEDFEKDLRLFLGDGNAGVGSVVAGLAERIRRIDPESLRALVEIAAAGSGDEETTRERFDAAWERVEASRAALASNPGADDTVHFFGVLWEAGGREWARRFFESVLQPYPRDAVPAFDPAVAAASVNGRVIARSELDGLAAHEARSAGPAGLPGRTSHDTESIRRRVLDRLIEREVVYSELLHLGGQVPEAMVENEVSHFIDTQFGGNEDAFRTALRTSPYADSGSFRAAREAAIGIELMKSIVTGEARSPSHYQVESYYRNNPHEFQEGVSAHVHSIAVRDREQAEALLDEIRGGASFDQLATAHSIEGRASKGGCWDWIEPGTLAPEFSEAVFRLRAGETTEVLEKGAFYIFTVKERKGGTLKPFDSVRADLAERLLAKNQDTRWKLWLRKAKARATVELVEDLQTDISGQ